MPPLQEEEPYHYVMTPTEVIQYNKQLEKMSAENRRKANDPNIFSRFIITGGSGVNENAILQGNGLGLLIAIDPIDLYNDRKERLRQRTCNRCGHYTVYFIDRTETKIKIVGYEGNEHFYHNYYEIKYRTIDNPGTLDDDFYDICKKCQNEILGRDQNPRDRTTLEEAQRELRRLERSETEREVKQNVKIERIQREINQKRKAERQADESIGMETSNSITNDKGGPAE